MVRPTSGLIRGAALVLAAALLWGTTGTAQSFAASPLSPYWVGTLRLGVAALVFLPVLVWAPGADLPARRFPWGLALGAAACMGGYNLAFFAGVKASGVAAGTAIALGSGPLWAGLLQGLRLRRLPSGGWWAGTTLAVAGIGLMSGAAGGPWTGSTGPLLCLAAGFSYALYTLLLQGLLRRAGGASARATAVVFVLAALMALPVTAGAVGGWPALGARDLAVVLWLGVMSTALAYWLYSRALSHLSIATAVAMAMAEPVVAFVLAVAVVGERPGAAGALGLLGVLAGLALVLRSEAHRPA